ncbi:MAG: ABC transporter permease [Pyrobaculum sp.]
MWAIVEKDLKEVLSSRYFIASLLGGFVLLIALGAVMGGSVKAAASSFAKFAVVVDNTTQLGWMFVDELARRGGVVYRGFSAELLDKYGFVVFVPANFSFPAVVELASKYRGVFAFSNLPAVDAAAEAVAERIGLPPRLVEQRVYVYFGGRRLSLEEVGALFSAFFFSWLFMFIVPMMVASTAAVAVGVEKEKKMFELILSTPATATSVVVAKFFSALLLAVVQFLLYAVAFAYYISAVTAPSPTAALPLDFNVLAYALASAFALSIVVLSMSFLVAVRTEDLKTAQSVVPAVVVPMLLPSFAALFTTVDGMEWYPFTHPMSIAASLLMGQPHRAVAYLLIDAALAAAAAALALRLATPQYIVLGRRRR